MDCSVPVLYMHLTVTFFVSPASCLFGRMGVFVRCRTHHHRLWFKLVQLRKGISGLSFSSSLEYIKKKIKKDAVDPTICSKAAW